MCLRNTPIYSVDSWWNTPMYYSNSSEIILPSTTPIQCETLESDIFSVNLGIQTTLLLFDCGNAWLMNGLLSLRSWELHRRLGSRSSILFPLIIIGVPSSSKIDVEGLILIPLLEKRITWCQSRAEWQVLLHARIHEICLLHELPWKWDWCK